MSDGRPRILFVEDEVFIGFETKLLLEEAGYHVIGPLASVQEALRTLESTTPDIALLDVNLNGVRVTPVAERLNERAVPFALLTGYSPETLHEPVLRQAVVLRKPFNEQQAFGVLRRLLERGGGSGAGPAPS
ncbi:Response regulator receiver domain-containing protein [Tistlia consotensis]|uniref:Response regulator receiver domain-containing protein n=1 Tax=Tistlia consotensis USBA 355 TaxID=560819 RepID=A0A1Y6BHV6_9PROT|nr:response regulator [Tistlia consotensis]SMF02157.1 Response regulator receiver domain-containing protein [Tistlia consotensis USBA 355]SNS26374.1 Response regulator receiver domain-containing protein [Tistlia consotensis]